MKSLKLAIYTLTFLISFSFVNHAYAATEFISVVDTGNGTDTDYTSLSAWETGVQTDLTLASTLVFAGTKTGTMADNASVTGSISLATATVVHATDTQILLESISGTFQSGEQIQIDGSNYFTTSNTGDSAIAVAKCRASTGAADTTAVTITGWTTSATNYIKVWTDPTEGYRHEGKWDDRKYRIDIAVGTAIDISEDFIKIDGLQVKVTSSSAYSIFGFRASNLPGGSHTWISNNIVVGVLGGTTHGEGITMNYYDNPSDPARVWDIWNNVVYGFNTSGSNGILGNSGDSIFLVRIYNNTVYDCDGGIGGGEDYILKNNISYNNNTDYFWNPNTSSTNNLSSDNSAPAYGTYYRNATVTFADETNDDFHLKQSDTGAKNVGANLSADANLPFSTDIDGSTRTGTWDIGADEAAIQVFYSVGQNTNDHSVGSGGATCSTTGACTLTISSGVATFNYAQTATNMGVGDKVTYNTTSIAYISEKISDTTWKLTNATGGTPADISDSAVVSIAHPFASLSAAEAGADDASYLNTADLVAGNYQLNIPCYYDTGADTTAVTINGWTTGSANYIKVYTPNNTATEVNQSQRHSGKWEEEKYRLEIIDSNAIISSINFYSIDGLQIKVTASSLVNSHAIRINTISSDNNKVLISNNILRGSISGSASGNGFYINSSSALSYFWNNIVYDFINGTTICNGVNLDGKSYAYNNTFVNNYYGLHSEGDTIAKNNIIKGSGNTNSYIGTFAAGTDYNATDGTDDIGQGSHNKISQTFTFADEANDDFHLASSDMGARNYGADLSADSYLPITNDIDGHTRSTSIHSGNFDIGADEAATQIFYSVGQNTNDHSIGSGGATCSTTGACTLTISSGVATFNYAQTATNMGVGDKVTYNTTSVAYISEKISDTQWKLITATGTMPADVGTAQTVNSIAHPFASLSAAETRVEGANYLNTNNLATGNYQLNVPCYYDTGADATAVTVDGWTTAPTNYIKIYTPNNTTNEVNLSQRHSGKWDDIKYRLSLNGTAITVRVRDIIIDGLQADIAPSSGGEYRYGIVFPWVASPILNTAIVSNNIVKQTNQSNHNSGIYIGTETFSTQKIFNNIVYDFKGGSDSWCFYTATSKAYFSNNTADNCETGFFVNFKSPVFRNNIAQNSTDGYLNSSPWGSGTDYNISNLSSDAPSASYRSGLATTVTFQDEANDDFHLSSSDTYARNAGTKLSADSYFAFSTDIDGNGRSTWDIGADEGSNEIVATVMQTGGDYSSISAWESGMQTDLTSTGTMVYGGTRTDTISDNAPLYLCRSGVYQSINGTTVHATATQILVESISDRNSFLSGDVWYTNNTCNSANYFTTSDGGNPAIAVAKIDGEWTIDDARVTIDGWKTGSQNYIKIYTTGIARHQGKWNDEKYRIVVSNTWPTGISSYEEYTEIEGLQIAMINPTSGSSEGIRIGANNQAISSNLIRGVMMGLASSKGIASLRPDLSNLYIYNNIVYGFGKLSDEMIGTGIHVPYVPAYVYNNTVVDCGYGFFGANSVPIAKNNIAYNNYDNYYYGFDADSTNNLSGPTQTDAPGSNPRNGVSVVFADEANDDFHLAQSDTGAKNVGADLSADANFPFSTDIDGSTRTGTWDIGADEAAIQVFYSVGQNTNDHKTGSPALTIASGVGIFSVAQTATNMGVGDKVTYNTSTVAYISEKISDTQWKLITVTGGTPANITDSAVVSIAHAFASLSAAEAGAEGVNYLNTSNLVTGNYQLNIPCYYDTGADTTTVRVDDWTTAPTNYIKIYTPNNTTTEVNQSQRHSGKWDDTKYRIEYTAPAQYSRTLSLADEFTRVEGLQIKTNSAYTSTQMISIGSSWDANNDIWISNNILYGNFSGDNTNQNGIDSSADADAKCKIFNNLIYNIANIGIEYRGIAYNNTVYNSNIGIDGSNTGLAKNNIVKGSGDTNSYIGTFASGTDYNATDGTDDIGQGSHNKISQTFTFADEANDDFRLSLSDAGAKDSGTDLSADTYLSFSEDISGQLRSSVWDIGASEAGQTTVQSKKLEAQSLDDGLVLYQTFDGQDINGTTAIDRSGQGNDGTISGATKTIGKRGQALSFDGSDDYVDAGSASNLDDLSAMTISMWAKADGYGELGQGYFIAKSNFATTGWRFQKLVTDSTVMFAVAYDGTNDLQIYAADNTLTSSDFGQWIHWTVTWDGSANTSGVHIYKNGTEVSYDASSTNGDGSRVSDSVRNIILGNNSSLGVDRTFDGSLDETRVYNRVLSADEVKNLYNMGENKINAPEMSKNTNGLVGHWSFDGQETAWTSATAGTTNDLSGNSNTGTLTNMSRSASPALGKLGQALKFDGVDDYVSIADSDSLRDLPNTALTFSAWVKVDDTANQYHVFSKYTGTTTNGWAFLVDEFRRAQFYIKRATTDLRVLSSPGLLPDYNDGWFYLAVTYPGGDEADNVHIYVNGSEVSSYETRADGVGSYMSDNGLEARIGCSGYNIFFDGNIDDSRLYNRVLSASEIADLYKTGVVKISK